MVVRAVRTCDAGGYDGWQAESDGERKAEHDRFADVWGIDVVIASTIPEEAIRSTWLGCDNGGHNGGGDSGEGGVVMDGKVGGEVRRCRWWVVDYSATLPRLSKLDFRELSPHYTELYSRRDYDFRS